jgi:hypothetical protein
MVNCSTFGYLFWFCSLDNMVHREKKRGRRIVGTTGWEEGGMWNRGGRKGIK